MWIVWDVYPFSIPHFYVYFVFFFFFSSRRRHTRFDCDWSSDVCSSDLDAKPEVLFSFIPAGKQATQIMKAYGDLGLDKAGVKFIGPGDITTDEELPNMGDVPLGVITAHHYSAAATRPANKAFIAAWKKEYGEKSWPSFMSVGGWDAMDAVYYVIREQKGKIDPDRTMELVKQYKNPNSPRGPISIDPATRDIVQNIYIREVRKVGGQNANVELETIPAVKDPWQEYQKK